MAALGALEAARGPRRSRQLDQLALLLERADPGALSGAPSTLQRRLGAAGLERGLARLFAPRALQPGQVWFPVALDDGRAVLRLLCVGWRRLEPPRFEPGPQLSDTVERAGAWIRAELPPCPPATELGWWLEPDVPSNRALDGGSVGLAALAAWTSWVLRVPLPDELALTGCLAPRGADLQIARVDPHTLPAKIQAVVDRGLRTLGVPPGQERAMPGALQLEPVARAQELLEWLFTHHGLERHRRIEVASEAVELDPAEMRLISLLLAAPGALALEQLDAAILLEGGWPQGDGGNLLHAAALLDRLATRGMVRADPDDRWEAVPAHPWVHRHSGSSARWQACAHRALAQVCPDPVVALGHRLAAGEEATGELEAQLGAISSPRELLGQLDVLAGGEAVARAVRRLPPRGTVGALRLCWGALGLPWPCARVAAVALGAHEPRDQLYGVQAVLEATLHLIAAVAVALGVPDASHGLDRRPSFGGLASTGLALIDAPGVHPVAEALRPILAAQRGEITDLVRQINHALHAPGAVALLGRSRGHERAGVQLDAVLVRACPLVEELAGALSGLVIRGVGRELVVEAPGGTPLGLGRQLRVLGEGEAQRASFFRGLVDGRTRWWSYEDARVIWPEGAPFPATGPAIPEAVPRDRLPQPLARLQILAGRPGADDPHVRLGIAELYLAVVLRLVWFPRLVSSGQPPVLEHGPDWLSRMNHRNLIRQLEARAPDHELASVRPTLWRVVDRLERLGHAPRPLPGGGGHLDEIEAGLRVLDAAAPWGRGEELVGWDGERWLPLVGPRAPAGLERPGRVALRGGAGLRELGPWAVVQRGELWWLAERRRARRSAPLAGTRGRFVRVPHGDAPLEEAVGAWRPAGGLELELE